MFVQRGRVEFAAVGLGLLLAFDSTSAAAQDATPATSDPPIAAPVDTPPAAPRQPAAETPPPAAIEPATSAAPVPSAGPAPGSAVPASAPAAPTTQNGPATPPAVPEVAAQDLPSAEGSGLDITPHGEVGRETLPHDLSPWGMFLAADIVVKAVMIGLALASLITWTVWVSKSIELWFAKGRLRRDLSAMRNATSLADAEARLGRGSGVASRLVAEARDEHMLARNAGSEGGLEVRIASRLDGVVSAAGRDMSRGTGVLASIGSTAPFVGLFGTVWGIMNSFIGISKSQTTNLAVVAPGIAEALLATAIGLVAAIPAVIIYNRFARAISGYKAQVADAAAEVRRIVSREHDRVVGSAAAGRGAHHSAPASTAAEAAE